ncbi:MAG: molybdate ABC transporter permease subunit [Clostridium perfringens]|nr:molybdate ABC transporter permease subunit [Clostridium perfringens]
MFLLNDLSPLWISLKTTTVSTIIAFILGIYAARLVMICNKRLKGIIDTIFTLPMVLPPTVVGFFLLIILGKRGVIGNFLYNIGVQIVFSWSATVVAATVVCFPIIYRTIRGALEQIDHNVLNVARTLGMSESRVFWKIALPMAWPGVVGGIVLGFARALGEFGATLMLAGAIPGKTVTMPISIYFLSQSGDMKGAMIWVLFIVIISFFSILLINKLSYKDHKIDI